MQKTDKKISDWIRIFYKFKAAEKKSSDVVTHLQEEEEYDTQCLG